MSYRKIDSDIVTYVCSNCNKKNRCEATNKTQVCNECKKEFTLDLTIKRID